VATGLAVTGIAACGESPRLRAWQCPTRPWSRRALQRRSRLKVKDVGRTRVTKASFKSVTVRGGLFRLSLCVAGGAVLGALALFAVLAATLRADDPFDGLALLASPVAGAFLGAFFGGAVGWLWLVVAVGRESQDRGRVAPNSTQEPASRDQSNREG
jgi:hypothetical protein